MKYIFRCTDFNLTTTAEGYCEEISYTEFIHTVFVVVVTALHVMPFSCDFVHEIRAVLCDVMIKISPCSVAELL